ncbi:MAG: RES family NAD+ phosphorylase, partial [Pseudohongiellaceae bacterium]
MTLAVYRLVKNKHAAAPFDTEGARRLGGRWNSKGIPCVYTASAESLAMLEVMVHTQSTAQLRHYSLFRLWIPEQEVEFAPENALPDDWRSPVAPPSTQWYGDAWLLNEVPMLALAVPSTVAVRDRNFILNPNH